MEKIQGLIKVLQAFDELKPLNNKPASLRKYPVRFLILLYTIILYEGETQSFYATLLKWNIQNTNMHANSLHDAGFIMYGEESVGRYSNRVARALYPTKEAKQLMLDILKEI